MKFKINQKNIGGLDPRYFKLYTLSEILPFEASFKIPYGLKKDRQGLENTPKKSEY